MGRTIKDNDTYLHYSYDKSAIFPLISRPFWDLFLPVPRDYKSILPMEFRKMEELCFSRDYTHKDEHPLRNVYVKCELLMQYFPFVIRSEVDKNGINETLMINKTAVQWIVL